MLDAVRVGNIELKRTLVGKVHAEAQYKCLNQVGN
jgi:hypothetical protein